ncbi:MAG: ThiF family adenylyltransferase [Candidatus Hodarchaeales archaeon]|jgi:ubiquitin-activating enzyme E1 C
MVEEEKFDRFERQRRLEIWDQDIVASSRFLVVGAGGTGCEVLKNLSLLGIGYLIIVDPDTVEYSNLSRQLFYTKDDVGKPKAEVAASKIKLLNPSGKVEHYVNKIENLPDSLLLDSDVILGCLDNWHARMHLNTFCFESGKPLVDSATDGFIGRVRTIIDHDKACLACDNPIPPETTAVVDQPCTLVGKPRVREHCAWKGLYKFVELKNRLPKDDNVEETAELAKIANEYTKEYGYAPFTVREVSNLLFFHVPSVITVNAVISGIQSQEAIKILFWKRRNEFSADRKKRLEGLQTSGRFWKPDLVIYTALNSIISSMDLEKNPDCTVCNQPVIKVAEVELNPSKKLSGVLNRIGLSDDDPESYMITRGVMLLDPEESLGKQLHDGDTILVTDMEDSFETKVKVKFFEK